MDTKRIYFGTSGPRSAGPLVAVNAGTEGDVPLDGNFESEKVAWSRTRSGPGMASPVVANGLIYLFAEDGRGSVVRAGDSFEVVARSSLSEGGKASPAIADGSIYVRSSGHLYKLSQR